MPCLSLRSAVQPRVVAHLTCRACLRAWIELDHLPPRFPHFPAYCMPCKGLYLPEARSQVPQDLFDRQAEPSCMCITFTVSSIAHVGAHRRRTEGRENSSPALWLTDLLLFLCARVVALFRDTVPVRASIPFIHSCSVGLSPRAGYLLSRPHPSRMRDCLLLLVEMCRRVRRTLLYGLASRDVRTTLAAVVPFRVPNNLFFLPPGPRSFVRLSEKWKRVVPWWGREEGRPKNRPRFTLRSFIGKILYSIANTSIRGNAFTKRRNGMGEAGRRASTPAPKCIQRMVTSFANLNPDDKIRRQCVDDSPLSLPTA